jgi:ATP-dependent Lon protease
LNKILGVPQVNEKRTLLAGRSDAGSAAGLAWTELGGDVLLVEAVVVPGRGQLILTGRLGEVMKESGQAALTFARGVGGSLGVRPDVFRKNDFHVHVAEGAIPKDGPSAGITISAALLSAVLSEPVAPHIAMTGEITLRGRVLPVGGLRSKLLAAQRYGISQVILPKENVPQVSEIPPHEIQGLKLHYVESIGEAMPILFPARRIPDRAEARPVVPTDEPKSVPVQIHATH